MSSARVSPQSSDSSPSGTPSSAKSGQTRVVVSQSKKGCVTCKARRVKCDEKKPMCGRCIRGGRLCGGYGGDGTTSPASRSLSLSPAMKDGVHFDRQAERLSHLASLVMCLDRNNRPLHEDRIWGTPFLQLSHSVECVKAAATAFGAAYEAHLHGHSPESHTSALHYYGSALQNLQSSVNDGTAGAESCALASLMLACVEILGQHDQNAFIHFLGACQILEIKRPVSSLMNSPDILDSVKQELILVDVMVGNYTMSQAPAFMHVDPQETPTPTDAFEWPDSAIKASTYTLHRAYRFIGDVGPSRYKLGSPVENDPVIIQGRAEILVELRSVYSHFETLSESLEAGSLAAAAHTQHNTGYLAEVYALRCQLASALIFIICIHSPFETIYDEQRVLFQSIISCAAASIRTKDRVKSEAFSNFSCRPGVLSPLFFVSMKCRDPSLRRVAIEMMREQGREGPTDGKMMAAIGARLAEVESERSATGSLSRGADISEAQRMHNYCTHGPPFVEDGKRQVKMGYSMPSPPFYEGWGTVDYNDATNWLIFEETLEL